MSFVKNRITAVVAGAAVLVTLGATGAVAADMVTGDDIQDGTLRPTEFNSNVRSYFDNINKRSTENKTKVAGLDDRVSTLEEEGVAGPQGEKGEQGPQGPQGPKGVTNLEADGPYPGATTLQDGDNSADKWVGNEGATLQSSWVMCAPGKTAVGGGFSRADEGAAAFKGLQIVTSQPVEVVDGNPQAYTPIEGDVDGSFVPNGWLVEGFNNNAAGELIVRPHVICATVN
jgi:hypothetical protein